MCARTLVWRKYWSAIWRKRKSFRSDLSDHQTVSRGRDDAVLIVSDTMRIWEVADGLLMPVCDLPDRLGQGVDDDGGFAVAEALDA